MPNRRITDNSTTMLEKIMDLADQAKEGKRDALEVYIELKQIADTCKGCLDEVKDLAIGEAEKYGKGEHEKNGAIFQVKNGSGRWSFKSLPWWKEFQDRQKQAKEAYKQSENGLTITDQDGIIIEPAEYTPGTSTIAITFKK